MDKKYLTVQEQQAQIASISASLQSLEATASGWQAELASQDTVLRS